MYKRRITEWKLDKKHKRPEMEAVARKYRQREAIGKKSVFHIRGKEIGIQEVTHYLRRAGVSIDGLVTERLSAATPPSVECQTPTASLTSPVASHASVYMPVPSLVSTPQELRGPELIFRSIDDYVCGQVDTGNWRMQDKCRNIINTKAVPHTKFRLQTFFGAVCRGLKLLDGGHFQLARKRFNQSMTEVKTLLAEDD